MAGLLSGLSGVQRLGDQVVANCPGHDDGVASLAVGIGESGKVLLKCFAGCSFAKVGGALVGVDLSGSDWVWPADLPLGVASADPVQPEGELLELRAFVSDCESALWESPEALAEVRSRFGLSDELIRGFRLGLSAARPYAWRGVGSSWSAVQRLTVPFFGFDGSVKGCQGRALTPHRVRWAGLTGSGWARSSMFRPGLFDAVEDGPVVICEGPSDALTVAGRLGFDAVAIRGAALRSDSVLAEFLVSVGDRTVIVCGDNDTAGEKFSQSIAQSLMGAGVDARVLHIPMGSDVNDWAMLAETHFAHDFRDQAAAAPATILGLERVAAVRASAPNLFDSWPHVSPPGLQHVTAGEVFLWFLDKTGRDMAYVVGYKGPTLWSDGLWQLGQPHAVRSALQECGSIARAHSDPDHPWHFEILQLGNKLASTNFLNSVIKELEALCKVFFADSFDSVEHYLAVKNGVIDLRDGSLIDPTPAQMISTRLDVKFNPEADCDLWRSFLAQCMGEESDPARPMSSYLQRVLGYGLTGSVSEQSFFVHYGTGANGKSTFTDTLQSVFRSVSKNVQFSVFEDSASSSGGPSSEIARLRGSRLVFTAEGSGRPMKEALLKVLSGGDLITARHLFAEEIEFHPRFLLQMSTNNKPDFRGVDEGLWRRVKLIRWGRYFGESERDLRLPQKLLSESEGILAWAVRGAQIWYRGGGLGEPAAVSEATEEYRDSADILAGFYPGVLNSERGENVSLADIYFAFCGWADSEGIEEYSRRWLRANLETRGVAFRRLKTGFHSVDHKLVLG